MNIRNKVIKYIKKIPSIKSLRANGAIIGENVEIWSSKIDQKHSYLLEIGNNVTISDARILLHDASTKRELGYSKVGKVKIGNNVFIGADAIILPGITIGNKVIIGAGAIVSNNIPDNSVVVGNPSKVICTYDEYIKKNKMLLKESPKYNTYCTKKTKEEKDRMKKELDCQKGFDI